MPRTVTASVAKNKFGDCLRDVEGGEHIVITRYGEPVAALVTVDELERLRRLRAASPADGLAGLVGKYSDGDGFAEALDAVVAERSPARPLYVPDDE